MRSKFKRTLAILASAAMCSTMLLHFPNDTFNINFGISANAEENTGITANVASITSGDIVTNYTTFADALANWTDGTTLTLLADVTLTERIETYAKGLILDLNGHKIECSDTLCTIWIDGDSGSELTIRDSNGGGYIQGVVYAVYGGSKLCLESGTVETVTANGDFTMTGGRIISEDFSGLNVNAEVDVVISGGEIYGSKYGVLISYGNVIISGDTKITGAGQYAIQSNSSAEVVISGTPTISGGAGEFILDSKITLNTQPANGEVWRVKINTEKITDGIFAAPGEGIALDASKFASAMDGYDVKQNAKGELLLCNHQTAYAAVSNEDGSTHKMLCCCRETTVEASVACSGFGATSQTKAVCAACGQSYGETNPDVHTFNDDGKCVCGAERDAATTVDLSSLTATYVISDSGEYIFTGTGSYGIKVESGYPKIVLNNVNISLTDGDYYENNPINGIHIATTGGTTEILVLGESSITAKAGAGIFVAEGGKVKITGSSREDILIATGASGCSGIGGYVYSINGSVNCGNIEISSVTVKAFGSDSGMGNVAPAIGGAGNANCGYITIDNADVYAEGFSGPCEGSSAIGTGVGGINYEGGTIGEISIINDSKVYVTRGNYCDYIGCCGSEVEPAEGVVDATAKSSTIYCYDTTDTTQPIQTLKYGALGDLLVEDENGNWVCDGEHSDDITTYQNEGSTITAICENCKCEFIVLALITENKIFDGTPVTAVVEKAGSLKEVTVDYYQGDTLIGDEAPINAGTYTAKITYEGVTASCQFEIAKATPTADMFNYSAPANCVYDGNAKVATVETKAGITGMGEITVKYYQNGTEVTPINAGEYTVKIDVAEGDNYAAATDIEVGTFEIAKATPTAEMFNYSAPANCVYDGTAKSATVTAKTGITGMGTITVKYYQNDTLTDPVGCGTYSVKISVADSDNNIGVTDLTSDNWMFTINHADADNDGYCDGCGAIYDGIGAHLAGYSVSLNGSIGVNFHMDLTQDVLGDNEAYMLFTLPNGTTQKVMVIDAKAKESAVIEGKTYYIFTCNVAAKEMTDTIQAQLITSDGSKTQVYEYSVREYADRILSGSYDAETKELVKAMLHYGAYSQEWFDYNTTNLANAGLDTLELSEADDWDEFNPIIMNDDKVGSFTSAYLTLESDTAINLKFKLADGVSFEDLRVVVQDPMGNVVPATIDTTENVCLITLTGIKASDLDTMYDFSVTDKEGNESAILYSAMSYACAVANSEMDQKLKNVTSALRIFNLRANEKFEY